MRPIDTEAPGLTLPPTVTFELETTLTLIKMPRSLEGKTIDKSRPKYRTGGSGLMVEPVLSAEKSRFSLVGKNQKEASGCEHACR